MAGGQLPFGFAPQGELTSYTPTLRERAADWLRVKLFTDDREGQDKANRLVNVGETMLPPFGFATSAYDAGRAGGEGNYGKAGFLTAMAMVPGYHGSPIKGLTKLEKRYGRNPVFLAVDDGTPRPREYASGYAGDEGQVYSAKFDDANVLDARTPEGRASLVSALDETYPLGGDFYLWEKGVKEGQLPGWGDDMLFRSLEKAGHKGALINERPDVVSAAIFDPSIIEMQPQGIKAYHGSPHSFDKFDMSKIGTGEGAQAYGHGLYFAENEGVAQGYKNALAPGMGDGALRAAGVSDAELRSMRQFTQSAVDPDIALRDWLSWNKKTETPEVRAAFMQEWNAKNPGHMYEVSINADPNAFLDWDKPLSEQPENVRNFLASNGLVSPIEGGKPIPDSKYAVVGRNKNPTGQEIYTDLVNDGTKQGITNSLAQAGIPGIKYLDAGSRNPVTVADIERAELDLKQIKTRRSLKPHEVSQAEVDKAQQKLDYVKSQFEQPQSRNYVVFDDKLISIVRKYGIAGASAMLGYNLLDGLSDAQAAELKKIEGK